MRHRKTILAALAALTALFLGCSSSPGDEAWMRIKSFSQGGTSVAVVSSDLESETTDLVDITVVNLSTGAQGTGPGTGISIRQVRIDYALNQIDFPYYVYRVSIYLPANASKPGESEATIPEVPIVPVELKEWITDSGQVPDAVLEEPFTVQAEVTLTGRTDEGKNIEVTGGIAVNFGPVTPPGPAETIIGTPVLSSNGTVTPVGAALNFTCTSVSSSLGHAVEYVFYWGDGSTTVSTGTAASHVWTATGSKQVSVQGRCRIHTSVTSPYSNIITVTVN